MELTPSQGLPFPSDEDFGNGALDLQFLAQTVDTKLFAKETALRSILYPPVKILGAAGTPNLSNGVQNLVTFSRIIQNRGFNPGTDMTLLQSGTYMMGVFIEAQCVGTVSANTVRGVSLSINLPIIPDPISGFVTQTATNSIVEPGTGNSLLTTQLIFDYQAVAGISPGTPVVNYFHTNTGSLMSVLNTSYIWLIKISELGS